MERINHPQDYSIYIDKLLKLNPVNKTYLENIELWGGEPLLGLKEFTDYLDKFIENFENLKRIKLSSNFTLSNSAELICLLGYTIYNLNKDIVIDLQISLDGPKEINDANRGKYSTDKVVYAFQNLLEIYPIYYPQLNITTNSTFQFDNLYQIKSYNDLYNWFDFYLTNFKTTKENINLKFNLFRPAKDKNRLITEEDGLQFNQIMHWADEYRMSHPIESKEFNWPIYRINSLKVCAAGQPHATIALSPSGELSLCHCALLDNIYLIEENNYVVLTGINLSLIRREMMLAYRDFKQYISLKDFDDSIYIYMNLNHCPFEWAYGRNLFFNNIPLYYMGAMQIFLKWSRETYG